MGLGLGIDTGGTYTDCVIYDFTAQAPVFSCKSPTTRGDLSVGVSEVIRRVPAGMRAQILLASLSTTLATNACVEGKGSRVALFLLGYDRELYARLASEYGLAEVPVFVFIEGRHGQRGQKEVAPDWEHFRAECRRVAERVDAIGIVEYWGVRNPEYEMTAREIAREETGLPVAAAHELTHEINSLKRAASTALNARLIPLIHRLIDSVRKSLEEHEIRAPLMIVRGDGSLMSEAFARERPVETLLSGPAASVMGSLALAGERDAVVVDIGGTTTDIAVVRGGRTVLSQDGVAVGGWRTGTRAIAIQTIGLGGDSRIAFDKSQEITIGPRRAMPLAELAHACPGILGTLKSYLDEGLERTYSRGEFYILAEAGSVRIHDLSNEEARTVEALAQGPLSADELAFALDIKAYSLKLERLEFLGIVMRAALTPTDIWHNTQEVRLYDNEAPQLGAMLMAQRLGITVEQLCADVQYTMGGMLYDLIARFLLKRELGRRDPDGPNLLALGYEGQSDEIACRFVSKLPLIGIGAPTHVVLPRAARPLHTRAVSPAYAGVANAVGAISGSVLSEERVTIKPHYETYGITGYSAHSPRSYKRLDSMEEAEAWALEEARRGAYEAALAMGASEIKVAVDEATSSAQPRGEGARPLVLEKVILARGMGKTAFSP